MRLRPPMQAVRSRFRCQKSAFSQQHIWIGRAVDRDLTMIAAKCDRCLLQDSESVKLTQQAVQKTACALDSLPYLRRVKPPVMLGVVDLADMRIDQRRIAHMDDTVQTCKNKFIKHRLLEASRDGTDLRPDFADERRAAGPAHWFKKTAVGVAVPNFRDQIIDRGVSHARPEDTAGTQAGGEDMDGKGIKVVAKNSKAYHDYFIEDKYEAGIELAGTEVKSIRQGHVNLKDSFCIVKDGQMHVHGMHISPYEKGNIFNKDPLRSRRLLMHKREILRLFAKVKQDGYALVPLCLYFRGPKVKLEVGLAKGKKLYDKRASAAAKDAKREMDRTMKSRRTGGY